MISKRRRRKLYRELSRQLGDPKKLSIKQRSSIVSLLGGWAGQHESDRERKQISYHSSVSYPARNNPPDERESIYEKHAFRAYMSFTAPRWHWHIRGLVQLPRQNAINCRLGIPALPLSHSSPAGVEWNWMHKGSGKSFDIMIPMNYHLAVAPHGVSVIDKKIIQRIWNHRSYSDKEVWECAYWDFSKLTKDESSWTKAEYTSGFVVKMAVAMAAEPTLQRALSMAHSRVVRAGVNSILSDQDE